jgi:hypothetical protein
MGSVRKAEKLKAGGRSRKGGTQEERRRICGRQEEGGRVQYVSDMRRPE